MAGGASSPQLLVFDTRRGNREGQEIEKVLAFHPADTPPVQQVTTAGLLHGLLLFSSNFSQGFWEVAESDKSVWVTHQAEPHIWLALAAPRAWVPRHCTEGNLQAVLVQAHQIVSLLHGPIEGLLRQDASGGAARRSLLPTLEHLGRQLANPLSWQHRQLRNPLADVTLAPLLRLSPPAALVVHNFCAAAQLVALGGGGGVEGVVVLHQQHMLWSTLEPADSAAVYSLAATALLHPQSALQRGGIGEASAPCILDSSCWHQPAGGKWVVLQPGCWRGAQAEQERMCDEEVACVPTVLVQGGQERCHLLPFKEGRLWVLLLVSAAVPLSPHTLATLQAAVGPSAQQLAAQVAQEVRAGGGEACHAPGYRYLYRDRAAASSVATPRVKISAMQHHSRALAAAVRESLARLEPPGRGAAGDWVGLGIEPAASSGGEVWWEGSGVAQESQNGRQHGWGGAPAEQVGCSPGSGGKHDQASSEHRGGAHELGQQVQRLGLQEAEPLPCEAHSSGSSAVAAAAGTPPPQAAAPAPEAAGATPDVDAEAAGGAAGALRRLTSSEAGAAAGAAAERHPPLEVDVPEAAGANDVHEVFARSAQDCWAAARTRARVGRQLLVVRERKTERTLGEALPVMDAFADGFVV